MTVQIGILGASGFVGSALCERLYFEGKRDFVAFVRSSGNAWRLTRLAGLPVHVVDITDKEQARAAVNECSVLVNCALGDSVSALQGLQNVIDATRKARLERVVHLSSVAIYGQDPPPESATEAALPEPGRNAYGILKLRQDKMVMRLHQAGVPCYILCPGNITGPYSSFARGLVERLQSGPLPLVDHGRYPSNLVHVDNVVEAILAALRAQRGAGERYFVNETRPVSWRELFEDLSDLTKTPCVFQEVTRDDVLRRMAMNKPSGGLRTNLRIALSEDFRQSLCALPAFAALNRGAHTLLAALPSRTQRRMRERLQWPVRIRQQAGVRPNLDDRYVTVQARRVYHSPEKLQQQLGWEPPLSYERGLETLSAWLRFAGVVLR